MKEAMLYDKLSEQRVRCRLCEWRCEIQEGKTGFCRVRRNHNGRLYTLVYGRTIARHADPIEKKPLYHFHPGSRALSIATAGCNFRCQWCQNCEISQNPTELHLGHGRKGTPQELAAEALSQNCRSIAYTYTEPTIFFEYSFDTAVEARRNGLANVYVTNGYMTPEMLAQMTPLLDAAAVDLKAFRDSTYKKYTGARLDPVLNSLKQMKKDGVWVEVITLVVPGVNDDFDELREIARFIRDALGAGTPWHLSRFMPAHRMDGTGPTPPATLMRGRDIAREEGLNFVYPGNLGGASNTHCQGCQKLLVERAGHAPPTLHTTTEGTCPSCQTRLPGVGMQG